MVESGMPQIGDVIADKYRLEKVAGEGGMGIVYSAEHLVLKQRVAVKVLLPEGAASESTVERFAHEARAAARINSEHVARVLDAGSTAQGLPFLVMEFLEGCDLAELLALQSSLPVGDAVDYSIQALEGLAHAHAANLVHRDLKPANLFLGVLPDGTNAIKVLDFGISKTVDNRPEDKKLTGQHVLGSPVYMSPEQLRNSKDIDARADVWSMGVVMYELLAGHPPFDGEGVGEIFAAILEKEPVPLAEKNAAIPRALSDVVMRCLRRPAEERWASVAELARALMPFASDAMEAKVERAEQVLARSQQIRVTGTSPDRQRIVDAIDAATHRAIEAQRTRTLLLERSRLPAWLTPARAAAAVGVALGLVLLGTFAVLRASRHADDTVATAPPGPPEAHTTDTAEAEEDVADDDSDEPIMELPANRSAERPQVRGTKAKGGKPIRPKFLNSRE